MSAVFNDDDDDGFMIACSNECNISKKIKSASHSKKNQKM